MVILVKKIKARKMIKILGLILSFSILIFSDSFAVNNDFALWKNSFKKRAIQSGVSKEIVEEIISEAKFLSKVICFSIILAPKLAAHKHASTPIV